MRVEGLIYRRATSGEEYAKRCKEVFTRLVSIPEEKRELSVHILDFNLNESFVAEETKIATTTSTQTELQPTATACTQSDTPLQRLKGILSEEPRAIIETVFYDWIEIDFMLQNIKENSLPTNEDDQPSSQIKFDKDDFETQFDGFLNYCSIVFQDSS